MIQFNVVIICLIGDACIDVFHCLIRDDFRKEYKEANPDSKDVKKVN